MTDEFTVRNIENEDWPSVQKIKKEVGLSHISPSIQEKKFSDSNPTKKELSFSDGLVLEKENLIVGFIGTIPVKYRLQNNDYYAVTASAFAVLPEFRNLSLKLVSSYLNNKSNIDVFINSTAIDTAETIFKMFKFKRIPQKEYNKALFLVLNERRFIESFLQKKDFSKIVSKIFSVLISPLLYIYQLINKTLFFTNPQKVKEINIDEYSKNLDALWEYKTSNEPSILYGYRNSNFLKWHFSKLSNNDYHIFGYFNKNILEGYLIVKNEDEKKIGLKRLRIIDIFVKDNSNNIIDNLLYYAHKFSKNKNYHIIEMIGFPDFIRERFQKLKPFSRLLPSWPFLYRAENELLKERLQNEDYWYASPFDGDASF